MNNIDKNIKIKIIEIFLLNMYFQKSKILKNKNLEFLFMEKESFVLSLFFYYKSNIKDKNKINKYQNKFYDYLYNNSNSYIISEDFYNNSYINKLHNIKEILKIIDNKKISFNKDFLDSLYYFDKFCLENKNNQTIFNYFFILLAIIFDKTIFNNLCKKMFDMDKKLIDFVNNNLFNKKSIVDENEIKELLNNFTNEIQLFIYYFNYEQNKLYEKKDNLIKKLSIDKKLIFRKKDIDKILFNLLKMNNSNILITGKKGIGKTSLIKSIFTYKENYPFLKNIEMYQININNTTSNQTIEVTLKTIAKQQKDTIIFINFDEKFNYNLSKSNNPFNDVFDNELTFINKMSIYSKQFPNIKLIFDINFADKIKTDVNLTIIELKLPEKKIIKDIIKKEKEKLEIFHNTKLLDIEVDYLVNKDFQDFNSIINYLDEQLAKKNLLNKNLLFDIHNLKNSNLIELKENINKNLFGQDENIIKLINKFEIYKAGLNDENKPIASFMFSGNSGTGKTELAKLLADYLNVKLLRYDMSEFQESHSISKFLGSPAGYVGYEEGSLLIKELEKHKDAILLLDEIEKADSTVIKMFLQVLEEGSIKGSNGKSISLKNNIIIFTTNAGAKSYIKKSTGFISTSIKSKSNDTLKKVFPIEFLNRLDDIFYFENLNKKTLEKIVFKELYNMLSVLNKNIKINVSKVALNKLIEKGYDEDYGARNIKRIIDQNIKLLIAKKINNNSIKQIINIINIDYINDNYLLDFQLEKSNITNNF